MILWFFGMVVRKSMVLFIKRRIMEIVVGLVRKMRSLFCICYV